MEGIEEVLQNHSRKIEGLENQMTKIVNKVEMLEIKDQDILVEIGKLELKMKTRSEKPVPLIYPSKPLEEVTSMKNSSSTKQLAFKSTQATLKPGIIFI